jgi:hypothetical protein
MWLPDVLRPSSEIKKLILDGAQASKAKVIFVIQERAQNSLEIQHSKYYLILCDFSFHHHPKFF